MAIKHTITISFKTKDDLKNHPVLDRIASDMEVQLESLTDGTYDEQEEISTEGLDTNVWGVEVNVASETTEE